MSSNILCINIVNPLITSLGSTENMGSVDKETQTVSADQGATGETAVSVPLAEAEMTKELKAEWLQFLKQKKEEEEIDKMVSDLSKKCSNEPVPKIDLRTLELPHLVLIEDGHPVPQDYPKLKGSDIHESVSETAEDKSAAPPVKNSESKND